MIRPTVAAFLVLTVITRTPIFGQGCCGISSSVVAAGHPTLSRGTFLVQTGADYARAEQVSWRRTAATLNLAYGITNRLAASLKTDYSWLQSSVLQKAVIYNDSVLFPEQTIVFDNHGFGDGALGMQYSIIPMDVLRAHELKVGADVGIPWGLDRKEVAGAELPKNMQTGSGGVSIGAFVSWTKAFPSLRLGLAITTAGRLRLSNRRGEDPGDEIGVVTAITAGPFRRVRGALSLSYRTTGVTVDVNGANVYSGAGSRLDMLPALELVLTEHVWTSVGGEFPLWRDEYQAKYGVNLGLRASLLFFIPAFAGI